MNACRLALQQFLLTHRLTRTATTQPPNHLTTQPSSPYDRLEAFTVGIFLGGWLLAILSHL